MEPASALADLTEISTQLETAVLARPDGSVVASTVTDEGRAAGIASNAVALLDGARSVGSGGRELTQVQAATREGCVFVVRDERYVLAAVSGAQPTVGLVFYDLKATLRRIDSDPAKRPKARAKPKAEAKPKSKAKPKPSAKAKAKAKPKDGAAAKPRRASTKKPTSGGSSDA